MIGEYGSLLARNVAPSRTIKASMIMIMGVLRNRRSNLRSPVISETRKLLPAPANAERQSFAGWSQYVGFPATALKPVKLGR